MLFYIRASHCRATAKRAQELLEHRPNDVRLKLAIELLNAASAWYKQAYANG